MPGTEISTMFPYTPSIPPVDISQMSCNSVSETAYAEVVSDPIDLGLSPPTLDANS